MVSHETGLPRRPAAQVSIPIIDLFAGPGGLGEGFSSLGAGPGKPFRVALSIEMDQWAHKTLSLRAFFRQFEKPNVPSAYYRYLRREITLDQLRKDYPLQFQHAQDEAWCATLGEQPPEEISNRINTALRKHDDNWLLIGGPPCQAYSLAGRSRIIGAIGRAEYEKDHRHFLYREYLRIIAKHQPTAFVMENVKGLLSAKHSEQAMFPRILQDLEDPFRVWPALGAGSRGKNLGYRLFSVVTTQSDLLGKFQPADFVVQAEQYGIPQTRHRIIILGIRDDRKPTSSPGILEPQAPPSVREVIGDLPPLRSGLSNGEDTARAWVEAILNLGRIKLPTNPRLNREIQAALDRYYIRLTSSLGRGERFMPWKSAPSAHKNWFVDPRILGVCNHDSRSHIPEDLRRYFFASVFAAVTGQSPRLKDFPTTLLPKHENVREALTGSAFNDRFRVQLADSPATTIVSHIAKDGHYYIHHDPLQCRSLTVREAARLQTFPDNYLFEGPRTEQYRQVGNAVPPLLARQIAHIVAQLFQ